MPYTPVQTSTGISTFRGILLQSIMGARHEGAGQRGSALSRIAPSQHLERHLLKAYHQVIDANVLPVHDGAPRGLRRRLRPVQSLDWQSPDWLQLLGYRAAENARTTSDVATETRSLAHAGQLARTRVGSGTS